MNETLIYHRTHCDGASYAFSNIEQEIRTRIYNKLMWMFDHDIQGGFKKLDRRQHFASGGPDGITFVEIWMFESKAEAEFFQLKWG